MPLDVALHSTLVDEFTTTVMRLAKLPSARRGDVEAAPQFSSNGDALACTSFITGSAYQTPWDGTKESAVAFAIDSAEADASLISTTARYAWLRSRR